MSLNKISSHSSPALYLNPSIGNLTTLSLTSGSIDTSGEFINGNSDITGNLTANGDVDYKRYNISCENNGTQSITNNVVTAVNFNTVTASSNFAAPVSNSQFLVPRNGRYLITYNIRLTGFPTAGLTYGISYIVKNGDINQIYGAQQALLASTNTIPPLSSSAIIPLNFSNNDYFQIFFIQNTTGAINIGNSTPGSSTVRVSCDYISL